MSKLCSALWAAVFAAASIQIPSAQATQPPAPGASWPAGDLAVRLQSSSTQRGFTNLTRTVIANREALASGAITPDQARSRGGTVISGSRQVPVLLLTFADTASDPYPPGNLQTELFGSWPTGTMTDFYREISYKRFTVGGTVSNWYKVSRPGSYYEGQVVNNNPCNGLCGSNRVAELLKEVLAEANKTIDFSQYDNDGPDGVPNSGDDDGHVDFVAFVHPGRGGECGQGQGINNNIWSHRSRLSDHRVGDFETKDLARDGKRIRIDDYVIMPALACDGTTMIQIGVFCHEFGHAFGLPDLYDTTRPPGTVGVGQWDLMGYGSWGGDGRSPQRPAHMGAWSKAFLGWVNPFVLSSSTNMITFGTNSVQLNPVELFQEVLRINVSTDLYYLVEYRKKMLFDDSLTGPGVLLWRINESVVRPGLQNNRVNADRNNPGVYLLQADGKQDLDERRNRGDAGDPFPGSAQSVNVDDSTRPAMTGNTFVCNISLSGDQATFALRTASGPCEQGGLGFKMGPALAPSPVPVPSIK